MLFPADLTTQLSNNGGCCSELASRIVEMLEVFPPLDQSSRCTNALLQLHTMAITLWNLAVTMKTKDNTFSNELNAQCKTVVPVLNVGAVNTMCTSSHFCRV